VAGDRRTESDEGAWVPPADLLHEDIRIRLNKDNELFIRLSTGGGALGGFCIRQRILIDDEWLEAVRADCSHGTVHVHYFLRDGTQIRRRELRRIDSFADVGEGYDEAIGRILRNWEDVARRF
jgi:hypothetical protein